MDSIFIKLLVLLATSIWWFPILRTLGQEAWRVSTGPEGRADDGDVRGVPPAATRASQGWEAEDHGEQRLQNSAWGIGRRKPVRRATSFPSAGDAGHSQAELPSAFQRSRK